MAGANTNIATLFDYITVEHDHDICIPISFEPRWDIDNELMFMYKNITIVNCDMFNNNYGLPSLGARSVDAIITDFPYGTLNKRNEWDKVIDYDRFWQEVSRIGKENSPTVTTAQMPFTAFIVNTNLKNFKYTMVWEKSKSTGYLNAKKQPMRAHEDIVVFYDKQCKYYPQMTKGAPYNKGCAVRDTMAYGKQEKAILVKNDEGTRYPRSIQYFVTAESEGKLHPTQKPIALYEWLIKTYSDKDDMILDPCMGSGTTAVACINNGCGFIGYEKSKEYFDVAKQRIKQLILNRTISGQQI